MARPKQAFQDYATHRDESEVVIRLDCATGIASISSAWPTMSRKFERRYGRPHRYNVFEGRISVAFWDLPIRIIGFRSAEKRSRPATTSPRKFPGRPFQPRKSEGKSETGRVVATGGA